MLDELEPAKSAAPVRTPRTCDTCGHIYVPWRRSSRFCSKRCAGAARHSVCTVCGKRARSRGLCRTHYDALQERRAKAASHMREYNARPEVVRRYSDRYQRNPDAFADSQLRMKHGITIEQKRAMAESQQGKCLICGEVASLHVDHCHTTGAIRGLLCGQCNRGLGHFKDNPSRLRAAALYLEKSRGT